MEQPRLMDVLVEEAERRGHKITDLSEKLGIGYAYLTQLIRNQKPTSRLSRPKLVAIARYLGIPVAQAYLWAGALDPMDFVAQDKFIKESSAILQRMASNAQWKSFLPNEEEWLKMPPKARLAVVLAFEKATGEQLVDKTEIVWQPNKTKTSG